jgi:hypothetical protein
MYENGFGVPQNYVVVADLYQSAATYGDAFGQSRLGLSYDKDHGVPQDYILAYNWLDLATARARLLLQRSPILPWSANSLFSSGSEVWRP